MLPSTRFMYILMLKRGKLSISGWYSPLSEYSSSVMTWRSSVQGRSESDRKNLLDALFLREKIWKYAPT